MSDNPLSEDRTVPMDFIQHLHQNPAAMAAFVELSSDEKLQYVRYVEEVTGGDARRKRIKEVIDELTLANT